MEVNVIVVCITLIIITFFAYMLFKDKKTSGSIEYDTKTGKLLMKKINNDAQKINNNVDKSESDEVLYKDFIDKREQLKAEKNNVTPILAALDIYKEFCLILHKVDVVMIDDMTSFIIKNGILEQTEAEFNIVIKNKVKYYIEQLNNGFSHSSSECLKKMNVEILMGVYKKVVFFDAVRGLQSIFENHRIFADKKNAFLKDLNISNTNDFVKKIMERLLEYEEGLVDLLHLDLSVSLMVIQDFSDTLHGLFIEYIKEFFQKK